MATRKAAGSAKNLTDSNAQYLGIKKHDGEIVSAGNIALKEGKVKFTQKRHTNFDGNWKIKKVVSIVDEAK